MQLSTTELRDIYEAIVKPVGHPDPIGFMARAMLTSEADPDYIDINGKQGFIPLDPDRAMEEVGAMEVQSLQGNIAVALAIDVQNMERYGTIEDMIVATHDGIDAVGSPSAETRELLEVLPEAREEVHNMLFPRLATVEDVISVLKESEVSKPSKARMKFFAGLLDGSLTSTVMQTKTGGV